MIKIGMMIGDRYEIIEKIGTGGMSDVYRARCNKLNRYVAVKVLKQEFSENANFVSKFRVEAQAAAGLMHPNIVNVYDVGEENGIYYIVMELVEGITLKKYIEKKARLSYKEAVSIAIQVSMGIEAAHNNHIIHRDIKPQNIIISRDGKVKVTDFGIAKAASSDTITSNVMGSVHYTSPEQARGGYSDEKSDIYSLGITIFEMLTGRLPFNGETTVAIAIKHIQEDMPSPRDYVPEIPASVEGIVMKCCQKSPDRRYQNMQELIADLKQSLINPEESFVVPVNPDTDEGTRTLTEEDMTQIKRHTIYADGREYVERQDSMRLRSDTASLYPDEEEQEEDEYDYNPRMEKITTLLTILAGVVICIIIILLASRIFGGLGKEDDGESQGPIVSDESSEEEYISMPDVKGMNVEDARNLLKGQGLDSMLQSQESDTVDRGVVISTDPVSGAEVKQGTTVTLVVSAGTQTQDEETTLPDLSGYTFEEANNRLLDMGFLVNKTESYSDTIVEGLVISQMPQAGTAAAKGSVITLTVSLGKEEVKLRVPNLIGVSEEDGTIAVLEAGLSIGNVSYEYSDTVQEGLICYQSFSEGSYVDAGTAIDIKVSQGARAVTYKCNANILAPTQEEAPDYVAGTAVAIRLVADDGEVLLDTTTSTFPQAVNSYGLKSSGGTITMTYKVTVGATTGTDENGNEVTTPGTEQEKSFTRRIDFAVE